MSTTELLQKSLDKIEEKLHSFHEFQAECGDRLLRIEQKGTVMPGDSGLGRTQSSLGARVVKAFGDNKDLYEKTRSVRLSVELKAAGDAVTTSNGRNIVVSGGMGSPTGGVLGLQNGLTNRPMVGTSAVEYSRYTGQQGAAAVQATEGSSKAPVRPDHTIITQNAITIAGFTKLSRQALTDSAELGRTVENVLLRSVNTALDSVLVAGSVAPVFDGFAPLATAFTSTTYVSIVDAISEGVATMQVAGFAPDLVALNPADWLALNVAKGTDGQYLSGSYLAKLSQEVRGLRVVISPSVTAGKALLMDSAHSELAIVDSFSVEIGTDGNDFTKNLATMLGEIRVIPIFRTTGSARLITPKAA